MDPEDAESIRKALAVFAENRIRADLAFIKSNFSSVVETITSLQYQGSEIDYAISKMEKLLAGLQNLDPTYRTKFLAILRRNVGFESLMDIRNILYGKERKDPNNEYIARLSPSELTLFKYCPVTSSDVERSFSVYKSILSEKRRSFHFENLKKYLILQCNFPNL